MTCLGNAHAPEIYRQNVEGGIRRTLENTSQPAYKRVGTVCGHGIYHQATRTASAQWFHDGGRKTAYKIAIDAAKLHQAFYSANQVIHRSRGTEYADGYKDSYQLRDDANGGTESFLGTFDKSIIDIHFLPQACHDEAYNNKEQEDIGTGGGVGVYLGT